MKVFTYSFTILCMLALFFYPLHMQSMDPTSSFTKVSNFAKATQPSPMAMAGRQMDRSEDRSLFFSGHPVVSVVALCEDRKLVEGRRTGKEEQTKMVGPFSLIELPNDALGCIASQSCSDWIVPEKVLDESIKFCIQLSTLCKKLHTLLTPESIGNLFKYYDQNYKNKALQLVMNGCMYGFVYASSQRLVILALIYVGANREYGRLLEKAVILNDLQCAEILFKHKVDPMIKIENWGLLYSKASCDIRTSITEKPIFIGVKTREMAQLFIDNGADIHQMGNGINILWHILDNDYSVDLMQFYLTCGVDAKKTNWLTGHCLLHAFAATKYSGGMKKLDNFLQKAKLLLETIPDKVNLFNHHSETPTDIAEHSLISAKKCKDRAASLAFKALIILFEEYKGFTRQELIAQAEWELKKFKDPVFWF